VEKGELFLFLSFVTLTSALWKKVTLFPLSFNTLENGKMLFSPQSHGKM
jgi:hypothetical protein